MRLLVVNANSLTRMMLERILSQEDAEGIFTCNSDDNFRRVIDECDADMVLICARKGYYGAHHLTSEFLKEGRFNDVVVMTESDSFYGTRSFAVLGNVRFIPQTFSKHDIEVLLNTHKRRNRALPLTDNTANPFADRVRSLIMKKDFSKMYAELDNLRNDICSAFAASEADTVEQLNGVCEIVLSMMGCTDEVLRKKYMEKFSFERGVLKDKFRTQFALFDMFSEVYKQRCIQKHPQFSKLFDYIDKNIYKEMTLADAAEACGVSQSYLSRELKESYGIGFNTYVQIAKVFLAKKSFYYNDDKIIDVAFQLSYNEPSYFCKVFKRIEGVTPTILKNEMMETREHVFA